MRGPCAFLALAALASASGSEVALAGGDAAQSSPISRIVTLLSGLKEKLEQDLGAESDLFATYKCWVKSTTSTKTASNEAATSRIDSLKTYIKDIEAGRIEFTTEQEDTQKQMATLTADLEQAKVMRESENKDYLAAKSEMEAAVSALSSAIKTIADGTKGSLAQTKSYADLLSTRHSVQKALAFGRGLLDATDQTFLERLMNGEEPSPDWKKLNRKATFKSKYQKSSGKILKTLGSLKTAFKANLDDAIAKEKQAQESYDSLKKSKGDMLDTAKKALEDMSVETGARGVAKIDAQNEVDALEAQVKADTKFITEAEDAFKIKDAEWATRKELRNKEILAMSQAIAVLASDDAKDQFKESFKSQGYLLIQRARTLRAPEGRSKCAARVVRAVAAGSDDPRLALLAAKAGNEQIDKVVKKIDEILAAKATEETEDLTKKEKCEKDLSDAASSARKASLEIDTASESITRASTKVGELKAQIKEQAEKKTGLQGQIKDLERQREDENTQFKSDKLADEKAVELVTSAIGIIKDWKNAKKASLIALPKADGVATPTAPSGILPPVPSVAAASQPVHRLAAAAVKVHTQASAKQAPEFVVDAGKAPPPPPPTWEAGKEYGGASGEHTGIVGILELMKGDIQRDIKAGETEEAESLKSFEKEKSDLEAEIKACDTTTDAYKLDMAAQEKGGVDKTKERATKKNELESQMKLYNSYKPGCDFLLVNFKIRTQARQAEMDGLKKAKAILKGADFGKSFAQIEC